MGSKKDNDLHIIRGFKTSGGSGKIVRDDSGEYYLETKKYVLGFTIKRKLEKCRSFDAAEDALNELQSERRFW